MRTLFLSLVVLLLCGPAVYGQGTPDGDTPANEGVCDVLINATPGLYGLCIAFCEAQDCEYNLDAEDPFENCRPSNPRILEVYNRKKQATDPDMPCIQEPCPCWSQEELEALPFLSDGWLEWCRKDFGGTLKNDSLALLKPYPEPYSRYWLSTAEGSNTCYYGEVISSTPTITRLLSLLTPEEWAICDGQLNQAAIDRGISCWD